MKELLPFVKNEIGHSLCGSIGNEYNKDTWRKELRHIKKVNPAIGEFIQRWTKEGKNKLHTAICGILVYRLLESQAEADKMNEEFG